MDIPPGLSQTEAEKRFRRDGPNQLPETERPGLLTIFFRQFKSPFIYVLLVAAIVSLGLAQVLNSVFILVCI